MLRATIEKLFEKHIVLDFTDHLSDYQLYGIIFRDILPSHEKMLERRTTYLHWDCANIEENPDIWLRYYATPRGARDVGRGKRPAAAAARRAAVPPPSARAHRSKSRLRLSANSDVSPTTSPATSHR